MKNKRILTMDKLFNKTARGLTAGIETEVYLGKLSTRGKIEYNNDNKVMNKFLDCVPKNVWRDHYPYQLEIKTNPHTTPESMLNDYKKVFQTCVDKAYEYGLVLIPTSATPDGMQYNGLHFHTRNRGSQNFYNTMVNSYPFLLSIAGFFRDAPDGINVLSSRLNNSRHIGLPLFNKSEFTVGGSNESGIVSPGDRKFKDVIINKNISKNFSEDRRRERSKDVSTLETRFLDVPSTWKYFESIIRVLYKVFKHIKTDEPVNKSIWNYDEYVKLARITREEILTVRRPYNYFFNNMETDVITRLNKWFKLEQLDVPFPILRNARSVSCYSIFREPMRIDKVYPFVKVDMNGFGKNKLIVKLSPSERDQATAEILLSILGNISESDLLSGAFTRSGVIIKTQTMWNENFTEDRAPSSVGINNHIDDLIGFYKQHGEFPNIDNSRLVTNNNDSEDVEQRQQVRDNSNFPEPRLYRETTSIGTRMSEDMQTAITRTIGRRRRT